jgi:hypothetical protein
VGGAVTVASSGLLVLVPLAGQGALSLRQVSASLVGESFILSIIAFLAAIIPIVFSVSTLAIQHAASNYTASVLEQYKKDRRTWFFYGFLAFGVILAASTLIFNASMILLAFPTTTVTISLLNSSFVILLFSLLLLPLQLVHVIDLIDPKYIVARAKEDCINTILSTPTKVLAFVKKAQRGDELERSMAKMPFYPEFAFHHNQDKLLAVPRAKVLQIMDIALKAALKREAETYDDAFRALSEIARAYVSIRKDYSSSEDEFLQYAYGKLVSMKKMALDEGDETLLTGIITTLGAIGCAAAEIRPTSQYGPNLNASLASLHISEIGIVAIQRGLWDPAADALKAVRDIGVAAIRVAKHDGSTSKKILALSKELIRAREWYGVNVASKALNDLLLASVNARIDPNHTPAQIMECMEEFSIDAIKNGMDWNALSSLYSVMPEYSLDRAIQAALKFKNEPHKLFETARREGYVHEIASSMLDLLIRVGIEAAEKKSSMVMTNVAHPICRIALTLMKEKTTPKGGFDDEVRKAIGGLAGIYQHADDCPLVEVLPDSLTDIALRSIDANRNEITLRVLAAIQQMAVETMEWDTHGYDAQRLAGRLTVIGSYAVNAHNDTIAEACTKSLTQFDTSYARKYGKPKGQLQLTEAQELHDDAGLSIEEWQDKFRKVPQDALNQFIESYKGGPKAPKR